MAGEQEWDDKPALHTLVLWCVDINLFEQKFWKGRWFKYVLVPNHTLGTVLDAEDKGE